MVFAKSAIRRIRSYCRENICGSLHPFRGSIDLGVVSDGTCIVHQPLRGIYVYVRIDRSFIEQTQERSYRGHPQLATCYCAPSKRPMNMQSQYML